jgi:hypothetical protein
MLSSLLSTPDTRLGQLTIAARSGLKKGSPCPKPPQLDITTVLVLSQLDLATRPLAHLSQLFRSSPS